MPTNKAVWFTGAGYDADAALDAAAIAVINNALSKSDVRSIADKTRQFNDLNCSANMASPTCQKIQNDLLSIQVASEFENAKAANICKASGPTSGACFDATQKLLDDSKTLSIRLGAIDAKSVESIERVMGYGYIDTLRASQINMANVLRTDGDAVLAASVVAVGMIPVVSGVQIAYACRSLNPGCIVDVAASKLGLVGKVIPDSVKQKFASFISSIVSKVAANTTGKVLIPKTAEWFDDVALKATRNADSNKVMLGHFDPNDVSYQKVAAHYNATYFKVENWNEVTKGMSGDEIWNINEAFLDQQLKQGKQILFSNDPLKAKINSFFKDEVKYLEQMGYNFQQKNQWTWEAVKK